MLKQFSGAKYRWSWQLPGEEPLYQLAQKFNLSIPVMQILMNRGINSVEEIERFLGDFDEDIAEPELLKDAVRAIERIERAISLQEKILIAGDYDVDGVTSSALLLVSLRPLGACINFFLPHRQRDGYGLSVATIRKAAANGYKVVITVDNGITAFEPAREAAALGIDLIITDHHRPHARLPEAYAIIDPHQSDCSYPFKHFAGVGVSFKLMSLLYRRCGKELPAKVYELLLLGTVADVVPLVGENRLWVRRGLRAVNRTESFAVSVLKKNACITKASLSSRDIGFYVAPQINALGRLDDAREAVAFLIGSHSDEIERIGKILGEMNQARKQIERKIIDEIVAALHAGTLANDKAVLIVAGNAWPSGVVGLVAARLVGLYGKPTIVLHETEDGILKGSCRSIPEVNMFEALQSVQDLLISFGGHPMAAGVSFFKQNLEHIYERLHAFISTMIDITDMRRCIYLDAEVMLHDLNKKFMQDLQALEPFGAGNQEPLFLVSHVTRVGEMSLLKDAHVKCTVFKEGVLKPVIFFNRPDLYHILQAQGDEAFHLAATVMENQWNGKTSIELCGMDVAVNHNDNRAH
jgi:single-stranded-DNA-specific exonuclease